MISWNWMDLGPPEGVGSTSCLQLPPTSRTITVWVFESWALSLDFLFQCSRIMNDPSTAWNLPRSVQNQTCLNTCAAAFCWLWRDSHPCLFNIVLDKHLTQLSWQPRTTTIKLHFAAWLAGRKVLPPLADSKLRILLLSCTSAFAGLAIEIEILFQWRSRPSERILILI